MIHHGVGIGKPDHGVFIDGFQFGDQALNGALVVLSLELRPDGAEGAFIRTAKGGKDISAWIRASSDFIGVDPTFQVASVDGDEILTGRIPFAFFPFRSYQPVKCVEDDPGGQPSGVSPALLPGSHRGKCAGIVPESPRPPKDR